MNTPRQRFDVHFGFFPGQWTVHRRGTPKLNNSSARIGYAKVSNVDQNLDAQIAALEAAGCTMIRTETRDGATLTGRPELGVILDFIHPDETLVVTRIDRLACSMYDLQIIVAILKNKGAHLAATEQPVDTSTAAGKAFFGVHIPYGVMQIEW